MILLCILVGDDFENDLVLANIEIDADADPDADAYANRDPETGQDYEDD